MSFAARFARWIGAAARAWNTAAFGPARQLRDGLMLLGFTLVTGVAGYCLLCGWSLSDALYMFLITVTTIGFGEIGPRTTWDRFVSSYVILLGVTAAAYTFGGLLQLMSEGQIRRLVTRQMQTSAIGDLRGHHIICGFGRMGAMICEDLARTRVPFVLIELDPEKAIIADKLGYLVVQGDASDERTLGAAGIERAKSLVCVLPSDADNVFVTLTGRDMNDKLFITARAEKFSTEKKLQQAGADRVVAPQVIGASRVVNLLTRPTTVEIMELVSGRQSVDLEMNEVQIPASSSLVGVTLRDSDIRPRTGVIVVAIKRHGGSLIVNPDTATTLHGDDTLVILGRRESIDAFRKAYAS